MKFEFPVKEHRFTSEQFDARKAAYVAKYGYTMHIPGFSDIVKFDIEDAPTEREVELYRKKDVGELGMERYEYIKKLMASRKESFLRMMSSPTPTWINNIGTTMTFLDDINDSLGTLSVLFRTLAHTLPKTLAKFLMGPAGWFLLGADIVNMAMSIARSPLTRLGKKSDLYTSGDINPFTNQAKVNRANRLKRIKPTKGEMIELLQTTNSVFGVGLCLGPLLGAAIEAFTGPYRVLTGKKVKVKWPMPKLRTYEAKAIKGLYAARVLNFADRELSSEDKLKTYLTAEMASHALWPLLQEYHPLDNVDGLENIIMPPPEPTDPLTKYLFDDIGMNPHSYTGFPFAEYSQTSASELIDIGFEKTSHSFARFARDERHTIQGQVGMQSVNNFSVNSLALLEGEDQVTTEVHPVVKACLKIIDHNYAFHPDTTADQMDGFARSIMYPPPNGLDPSFLEILLHHLPQHRIRLVQL